VHVKHLGVQRIPWLDDVFLCHGNLLLESDEHIVRRRGAFLKCSEGFKQAAHEMC
jgi:hypothetical protein